MLVFSIQWPSDYGELSDNGDLIPLVFLFDMNTFFSDAYR